MESAGPASQSESLSPNPATPSHERPLTIALICTQRLWHGGEEIAALLARGLRDRKHRVTILARSNGEFGRRMADEGFEVELFRGNGRNPLGLWQIRTALRRLGPDVIHYNDPHAITAAGIASVGLRIPARIAVRHLIFPIRWTLRYRLFCDRVICVSHAVAKACRESGIPAEMIRVVHGGIDSATWRQGDRARTRAALGLRGDEPLLLTVAQLTPCKGHEVLLRAMPAVIRRRPEVRLALAGDGPLRPSLIAQSRQLGIDSHVDFLGRRSDVPDLLAAADLFILPSLSEALSVSLMEAMLAGCPVATTTAGGIVDLVGEANHAESPVAWTVPPRNPDRLAEAILDALDNTGLRAERIVRARHKVVTQFSAGRMVDATVAVYQEAIGQA